MQTFSEGSVNYVNKIDERGKKKPTKTNPKLQEESLDSSLSFV